AQRLLGGGQGLQRGGADVRAVGEAEEHRAPLAAQDRLVDRPPVLVHQLERPADGRGPARADGLPRLEDAAPKGEPEPRPQQGDDDNQPDPGTLRHGETLEGSSDGGTWTILMAMGLSPHQAATADAERFSGLRQTAGVTQGDLLHHGSGVIRGRLRMRTLVNMRWLIVVGEIVTL